MKSYLANKIMKSYLLNEVKLPSLSFLKFLVYCVIYLFLSFLWLMENKMENGNGKWNLYLKQHENIKRNLCITRFNQLVCIIL